MKLISSLILIVLILTSCKEETLFIPKPATYLRPVLPKHTYIKYNDECPYTLSLPKIFKIKKISSEDGLTCHKDIELGPLNGIIHFSYIYMNEPLATYVNFTNNQIDNHKIKATNINDYTIINESSSVYCTFFELQGNVASPFQFYITDSVSNFVRGVVYFNSTPNYDSLKPSLDYLKTDLKHMITNFKWK